MRSTTSWGASSGTQQHTSKVWICKNVNYQYEDPDILMKNCVLWVTVAVNAKQVCTA